MDSKFRFAGGKKFSTSLKMDAWDLCMLRKRACLLWLSMSLISLHFGERSSAPSGTASILSLVPTDEVSIWSSFLSDPFSRGDFATEFEYLLRSCPFCC